ncbi:MAG TPA: MFS transporter, partial [Geminicoccaceae bacterium]|nr:MFS transporter [Geminicoccaceae bacterium]
GFGLFYRFAAADAADEAFRGRAISYVLAGGVLAAVLGPELAKATRELLAPILFAGCFLAVAGLGLATLLVLCFVTIPRPGAEERRGSGRPLGRIARQPAFAVAALAAMVAYGVMSLVMTATPLAMVACGLGFDDAAFVIQWHVLGMYAPSFFSGHLVGRFGAPNMIVAGALLIFACVGVNLSGVELVQFWAGLVLLGLGWNFMFVGATTLVTTTYAPAEKAKVQALNDFLMFGTVAAAALSSGALQQLIGWTAVNLAVIAPLLLALGATLWLRRQARRAGGRSAATAA